MIVVTCLCLILAVMKTSLIIINLILCCSIHSLSAQVIIKRTMINPVSVTLINDPSFHCKGALYQVNDSSISVSNSLRLRDYNKHNFSLSEYEIIDILKIEAVSRTRSRNGALIGAGSGIVLGVVLGLIENASNSSGTFNIADEWWAPAGGAIFMMPIGALVGTIIGGISIKIPIHGSMDNYRRNKSKLHQYALYK